MRIFQNFLHFSISIADEHPTIITTLLKVWCDWCGLHNIVSHCQQTHKYCNETLIKTKATKGHAASLQKALKWLTAARVWVRAAQTNELDGGRWRPKPRWSNFLLWQFISEARPRRRDIALIPDKLSHILNGTRTQPVQTIILSMQWFMAGHSQNEIKVLSKQGAKILLGLFLKFCQNTFSDVWFALKYEKWKIKDFHTSLNIIWINMECHYMLMWNGLRIVSQITCFNLIVKYTHTIWLMWTWCLRPHSKIRQILLTYYGTLYVNWIKKRWFSYDV